MPNMKFSNALIEPAFGAEFPRRTTLKIECKWYGDSILINLPISLSYANFPREQGTRTAKRSVGVMTRPRFAEKKI